MYNLSCNNFRLQQVLRALDLSIFDFIEWYKNDADFRAELQDLISVFREVIKIRAIEQSLTSKTKIGDLLNTASALPTRNETQNDGSELLAALPGLLGEEGEKILKGEKSYPRNIKHQ